MQRESSKHAYHHAYPVNEGPAIELSRDYSTEKDGSWHYNEHANRLHSNRHYIPAWEKKDNQKNAKLFSENRWSTGIAKSEKESTTTSPTWRAQHESEYNKKIFTPSRTREGSPLKSPVAKVLSPSCSPEEASPNSDNLSRSERKRRREMKRRSDVNRGFEELMSLIVRMNPPELHEVTSKEENVNPDKSASVQVGNLNRVDLMNKAVVIMDRLFQENKKMRRDIQELKMEIKKEQKNEVLMMFPAMVPPETPLQIGTQASNDAIPNPPLKYYDYYSC